MVKLNVFVVYSPHLENRANHINSTIDFIKNTSEKAGFVFNVNIIVDPSREYIDKNIELFKNRINYDKYPSVSDINKEFNSMIQILNPSQISNIEKHRGIYKHIMDQSEDDIYMIIEDDVVIGKEYIYNIEKLFNNLKDKTFEDNWDILFTCLPSMKQEGKMKLEYIKDSYTTLICKSSYFIKPSLCKDLYKYTEVLKFTLKNSFARFFYENPHINAMYLNKHTFLEASKIGIVPSSVNPNNFLFQNNQFILLTEISKLPVIKEDDLKEANKLFEIAKQTDSADILHIMGIIHYKYKDYNKAKEYMSAAVDNLKKNKGYLQQNSEILNNCINMYQYEQENLEEYIKTTPKYS